MDKEREFFLSTPWCAELLNDPDFIAIDTPSRFYKETTTEDALIAKTLKTEDTLQAITTFCRRPTAGTTRVEEVRQLISLGYGVNGYPHIAHGGIIGTVMDEAMGILLLMNKTPDDLVRNRDSRKSMDHLVTAYLKVTYLKPVITPQIVLVTAHLNEVTGKKFFIDGNLRDADGDMLANAEALWLWLKKPKEKL